MRQVKLSSNRLSIIIFILSAIILVLLVTEAGRAGVCIREQTRIEENRRLCDKESQMLAAASDYLTKEVWHFVATQKREYLDSYWTEVNVTKSREQTLKNLEELSLTDTEKKLIWKAKQESDELIQGEARAMRLTADSIGMPVEEMPPEVAAVVYKDGEEALSAPEKQKAALDYIFGKEYQKVKNSIGGNITAFRELLRDRKNKELENAINRSGEVLETMKVLVLLMVLLFIADILIQYFFIIRPFHFYELALGEMEGKEFMPLEQRGAKETRSFALAFNQIYSEWQQQKKRLEQERYRFRIALENTSDIVYEYDLSSDTYSAYGTLEESKNGQQTERIIPSFLSSYAVTVMGEAGVALFKKMITGTQYEPVELQLKSAPDNKDYIWVRMTGIPAYSPEGGVTKLIGKITNIQSEKEKEFALEDARSRDGLTGLYKKKSGIRRIMDVINGKAGDESCFIMILDMDDFGRLNEENGSVFADAVLQDVADILRENAGPEDIQVRLGGDEFLLLFKNMKEKAALETGRRIGAQIAGLSDRRNDGSGISASIGMSGTGDAENFEGLYRCAESALMYVKENEKGGVAGYMEASRRLGAPLIKRYPQGYLYNRIDRSDIRKEDLPSFALNLLGKSRNLNDAIYLLLSRVGNACHFDRVTVMEADMEYLCCHVIHQWVSRQAVPVPAELQYTDREKLSELLAAYDEDGLCDRYVIHSAYEIGSILHAAIWNYGSYAGCMSFEVSGYHQWTDRERSLLSELTRIISSFILKARADAVSQAKTDFLSRMSHEIRTPMNAITGMTTIAKTVLNDPEKELDCLNKIEFANRHLMNLINDILDMSRIESGKLEISAVSVDLDKLAENMDMLIRPQAEEKKLSFTIENTLRERRPVMADELHLNQILVNLLSNAVKFTDEGGKVVFRMESVSEETDGADTVIKFSVRDTGIGINSEAQKRIFNAFEQAESDTVSNYGGTGLGLSISSRLVQLMGGSLEVESAPGKGSVFFFTLRFPYASEKEIISSAIVKKKRESFDPFGKRLLLAEDNLLNREIAQEILKGHGFLVETAVDGKAATEQFGNHEAGYYDAILMDIRMPVMDGMEATRRIRTMGKADSRSIPIIAMTANAFDEDMKKSLENGMNGHLSKPIEVEKLFRMLEELIGEAEKPAEQK